MPDVRTQWPAAEHLQQAANSLREVAPDIIGHPSGLADPVADWLDETANHLAAMVMFGEHAGGYRPWELATRIAHAVLGLPEAAGTCSVCHTHVWPAQRGRA